MLALSFVCCCAILTAAAQDPPPAPPAPPILKLPTSVKTREGEPGKLKVETTAQAVEWYAITPGLSLDAADSGRTLYYWGKAGVYDLIAYTAAGNVPSKPAKVTITIGDPAPGPPPGPGPGPGPNPPVPPPTPVDPLKAKLKAAFESATGSADEKADWVKDLAALYRAAAKLAVDPTVTTAAALKSKLRDASATLIGPDALREVRQVVAGELAAVLPTTDADLTDAQRTAAAALFGKLASLLEGM